MGGNAVGPATRAGGRFKNCSPAQGTDCGALENSFQSAIISPPFTRHWQRVTRAHRCPTRVLVPRFYARRYRLWVWLFTQHLYVQACISVLQGSRGRHASHCPSGGTQSRHASHCPSSGAPSRHASHCPSGSAPSRSAAHYSSGGTQGCATADNTLHPRGSPGQRDGRRLGAHSSEAEEYIVCGD